LAAAKGYFFFRHDPNGFPACCSNVRRVVDATRDVICSINVPMSPAHTRFGYAVRTRCLEERGFRKQRSAGIPGFLRL